jgi:hypothetical protein
LFNHKEEWNYAICRKMNGTGDHQVKQNKSASERQISHIFSHIWNLDLKKLKKIMSTKGGLFDGEPVG